MMGEFHSGTVKRHQSPTKRLIAHKNSTVKHKKMLNDKSSRQFFSSSMPRPKQQHYTTAPGQSYTVEARGGELNYDLATKNPTKFYKHVMQQDLVKRGAKDDSNGKTKLSTTLVKRKVGRILMLVLSKFVDAFRGQYSQSQLERAFNDNSIKVVVQKHMNSKRIQLVDSCTGQPMAPKEMSIYGNDGVKKSNSSAIRQPGQTDAMGDDGDQLTHASLAMA